MIERIINLNLNTENTTLSDVVINQGNVDSVRFKLRVFDGLAELDYSEFNFANVTFGYKGKILASCVCKIKNDGILCMLPNEALSRYGTIVGQLDLKFGDYGNLSTNHFSFNVTQSLTLLVDSGVEEILKVSHLHRPVIAQTNNQYMLPQIRNVVISTDELEHGVSPLGDGIIHIVYK